MLAGICMEFVKKRVWHSLGLLLSCLAVSRIFIQLMAFYSSLVVAFSFMDAAEVRRAFTGSMFINEFGLWSATWLSVFYCAKIAKTAHPLFLWLKRRIPELIPRLILGSLLYTSINSIGHNKYTWRIFQNMFLQDLSRNGTSESREDIAYLYSFLITGMALPFLIFLVAVLFLIISLGRHTRQMRLMGNGGGLSKNTPLGAMLSILSFLILFLSHYVTGILLSAQVFQTGGLDFLFCLVLTGTYPSAHSIILILGNSQLKQNIQLLLLHGRRHT
ncbi:taste receptor type 2 member 1 [Rhynchocyon petersi]